MILLKLITMKPLLPGKTLKEISFFQGKYPGYRKRDMIL